VYVGTFTGQFDVRGGAYSHYRYVLQIFDPYAAGISRVDLVDGPRRLFEKECRVLTNESWLFFLVGLSE